MPLCHRAQAPPSLGQRAPAGKSGWRAVTFHLGRPRACGCFGRTALRITSFKHCSSLDVYGWRGVAKYCFLAWHQNPVKDSDRFWVKKHVEMDGSALDACTIRKAGARPLPPRCSPSVPAAEPGPALFMSGRACHAGDRNGMRTAPRSCSDYGAAAPPTKCCMPARMRAAAMPFKFACTSCGYDMMLSEVRILARTSFRVQAVRLPHPFIAPAVIFLSARAAVDGSPGPAATCPTPHEQSCGTSPAPALRAGALEGSQPPELLSREMRPDQDGRVPTCNGGCARPKPLRLRASAPGRIGLGCR